MTECPRCKVDYEPGQKECEVCGLDLTGLTGNEDTPSVTVQLTQNVKSGNPIVRLGCGIMSLSIVVAIVGIALIMMFGDKKPERQPKRGLTKAEQAAKIAECKKDLRCWAEKHDVDAYIKSREIIERHAKYQFEWTDGFWDSKITRFRWHNKNRSTVTYLGDKIKFQNGFGAWQNMIYQIDYDPLNKKLLNVSVRPGRL